MYPNLQPFRWVYEGIVDKALFPVAPIAALFAVPLSIPYGKQSANEGCVD